MSSRSVPATRPVAPVLRVAVLLVAVLVVLVVLDAGRGPAAHRGPEDAPAARAVAELTGPRPGGAHLPSDLERVIGHRVLVVAGRPLSESDGCSSPVPLPAAFGDACRAHDLGYDLLRYAARRGAPLGGWARRALDAQLARDLSAACDRGDAGGGCRVAARLADAVVSANSWRQGFGVPVAETAARIVASTLAAVVTAGASTGRA